MAENSAPRNSYADLGVSPSATAAEIRAAYLRLARLHHPDKKDDNDSSEFRKVQEAYEHLRNVDNNPRPFNIFNPRKAEPTSGVHPNAKFYDTGSEMEEMDFFKTPSPKYHMYEQELNWAHGVRIRVSYHPSAGFNAKMCSCKSGMWTNEVGTRLCIFCMTRTQNARKCPTCQAVACADCFEKIKNVEVVRKKGPAWGQ